MCHYYIQVILLTCLAIFYMQPAPQSAEILLYPADSIPNSRTSNLQEHSVHINNIRCIKDVIVPTLTLYKPDNANGMAIIICPGGGYARLAIDHEGTYIAHYLNSLGITAFVLKYRLPNDQCMLDKSVGPLQDLQQAIRLVRSQAHAWDIQKNKIGIMGFSAGGHLVSCAATHFKFNSDKTIPDTISVRPDFAILIYPVISFNDRITHKGSRRNLLGSNPSDADINFFSTELHVTTECPPVFLVHAADDMVVPIEHSILFYRACIKQNVPAQMHLYTHGGHGFGLKNNKTKDEWSERLACWLDELK